jgi:hypothetical protein
LKVLKPNLATSDHILVVLYHRGEQGATFKEIEGWVRPKMRANLGRTLRTLVESKDLLHFDETQYFITQLGQREVESRKLVEPTTS